MEERGVDSEETVGAGKVVSIDYVLTDTDGNVLDRSEEGRPLVYLHGARNIVEGLESALEGKKAGDSLKVRVPPEKGYGAKRNIKPQRVLRSKFPDEVKVEKGTRFVMHGPDGKPFPIWVTKVMGREVHVSPEHPLAGVTLAFDVTVRDVREATEEEKTHGHAHGVGGHQHE
jgi:FKBP-type peptidyl-prolyl cis-trans isomerase SlyD